MKYNQCMKVFISFANSDKKIAELIYNRLKIKSIDSWISSKDIPPGGDYQACIVEAIAESQLIVLVFSSDANKSTEIAKELSLASKKIVIPVRIEDVVPQGSLMYQLSNRQFVDLFEDFDNKLEDLSIRIKSIIEGNIEVTSLPKAEPKLKLSKLTKYFIIVTISTTLLIIGWYFFIYQYNLLNPIESTFIDAPINSQSNKNSTSDLINAKPINIDIPKNEVLASFPCNKAFTNIEKIICTSSQVGLLDLEMSQLYKLLIANLKNHEDKIKLKKNQIEWLTKYRDNCADLDCIKLQYENRIIELKMLKAE